jgi:hypothetical protein
MAALCADVPGRLPLVRAQGLVGVDGVVVLDADGRTTPVRRARVTIANELAQATTDTDTDGRFHADGLRGGTYHVTVLKFGFVPQGRVPSIVVGPGAPPPITVHMRRAAAIEGRVVTEAGEPVAGLVVSAARLGYGPYGRTAVSVQKTTTDDLGRYRVHTLEAGAYYLELAPDSAQMVNAFGIPGLTRIPTRTYYAGPGAGSSRLNDARVIVLDAGQQATGLDVTVQTGVAASVVLKVVTSAGAKPAQFSFRVQRVGGPPGEVLCFRSQPDEAPGGSCENVPPGDYWGLASTRSAPNAPIEFGATKITVDGHNIRDLVLTTAPSVSVTGQLELEGGGPVPPNVSVAALETAYELPGPVQGGASATPPVHVGVDGAFAFPNLAGPRLIRLTGLPDGWALKSVMLGTTDIVDQPTAFETIGPTATVRVTVARAGALTGVVLDGVGQPADGARVVVFAKDSRLWGARSRFIATAIATADGKYVVRGLLPGDYLVSVQDVLGNGAWEDPLLLDTLQGSAAPVTIAAGATATLDWRPRK